MSRPGGLDTRAPERDGRARDCYEVARTAFALLNRAKWEQRLDCARHALRLHAIAGELHRIGERECNEDLTCPECDGTAVSQHGRESGSALAAASCAKCAGDGRTTGKRKARLYADAEEIAAHYGLRCYFQTDPRGCPLYLIDPATIPTDARSLMPYDWGQPERMTDSYTPTPRADLATRQARWMEANYTQGHAVAWLGR